MFNGGRGIPVMAGMGLSWVGFENRNRITGWSPSSSRADVKRYVSPKRKKRSAASCDGNKAAEAEGEGEGEGAMAKRQRQQCV